MSGLYISENDVNRLVLKKCATTSRTIDISFDGGVSWTTYDVSDVIRYGIYFSHEECGYNFLNIRLRGKLKDWEDIQAEVITDSIDQISNLNIRINPIKQITQDVAPGSSRKNSYFLYCEDFDNIEHKYEINTYNGDGIKEVSLNNAQLETDSNPFTQTFDIISTDAKHTIIGTFTLKNGVGIRRIEEVVTTNESSGKSTYKIILSDGTDFEFSTFNGVGITKMEQTASSDVSEGENKFEFTTSDGKTQELVVKNGKRGNGLASMQQTATSTEDEGINEFTFKDDDGNTKSFAIRNGSKGDKGDKGEPGNNAYASYDASTGTLTITCG